jgi:hypothetical protein
VIGACAAVGIVVLFALTAAAGWLPLPHWTCQQGPVETSETVWVPVLLLNAPFGGSGSGNSSVLGTQVTNGNATGIFMESDLNISTQQNTTVWAEGQNARCSGGWLFSYATANAYAGIGLETSGKASNTGETNTSNLTSGTPPIHFDNDFATSNAPNVTTCGLSGERIPVESSWLTIKLPITVGGHEALVPWTFSLEQSFSYWFPANFGVWQVDNLSAPGGPGGGWAFSYSSCP